VQIEAGFKVVLDVIAAMHAGPKETRPPYPWQANSNATTSEVHVLIPPKLELTAGRAVVRGRSSGQEILTVVTAAVRATRRVR